jgi:hypothetical protein
MPYEMLPALLNIILEKQNKSEKSGQKAVRTLQINQDKSLRHKEKFSEEVNQPEAGAAVF